MVTAWATEDDVFAWRFRVSPRACSCGDVRCQGRLGITLHESHAGPDWTLTFRGESE